jgi:hypothetical protein
MKYPSPPDVAELRSRGYDPSTIARLVAEAEEGAKLWASAQQVCRVIETAFAGVTLGKGVGLREARGLDQYADAATLAAYRATDAKDDWRRITSESLQHCYSSLSFFDAEGMRFHLPAFLLADLRDEFGFGMAFCLTYPSDYSKDKLSLLSPAQRAAVRAFLVHILDDPDYEYERPEIRRALAEYWTDKPAP